MNRHVMDRCNLDDFLRAGIKKICRNFWPENHVEIVASLPCYGADNVDAQRGDGVFELSIAALAKIERAGLRARRRTLQLHLVYNPVGRAFAAAARRVAGRL